MCTDGSIADQIKFILQISLSSNIECRIDLSSEFNAFLLIASPRVQYYVHDYIT